MKYYLVPKHEPTPEEFAAAADAGRIEELPVAVCDVEHTVVHVFPDARGAVVRCAQKPAAGERLKKTNGWHKSIVESHGQQMEDE